MADCQSILFFFFRVSLLSLLISPSSLTFSKLNKMKDIIRDSSLGQLLRFVTGNKILKYHDETSEFTCPGCYNDNSNEKRKPSTAETSSNPTPNGDGDSNEEIQTQITEETKLEVRESLQDSEPASEDADDEDVERRGSASGPANPNGLWKIPTQADMQRTYTQKSLAERAISRPIVPVKTSDGTVLVDWWTTGTISKF